MNAVTPALSALHPLLSELEDLDSAIALLHWDQQTHMPRGGGEARGRAIARLVGLRHARMVAPDFQDALAVLEAGASTELELAAARNVRRAVDEAVRLPADLVHALAESTAAAFGAWLEAKASDRFDLFAPTLDRVLTLSRERAELLRRPEHDTAYDALLGGFDPGVTQATLDPMFDRLAEGLEALLAAIGGGTALSVPSLGAPVEAQERLSRELLTALGYDMGRGDLARSEHPFSVPIARADVRITTHLRAGNLLDGLGSTVHEAGHAMYEQGIPAEWVATGVGEAASYGVHESQSRFWENFIARSEPFCAWLSPLLERHTGVVATPRELYAASNRVERGLIRVMADEVTYNLHIIVRYRLERALMAGELQVADLPGAWSDGYAAVVGVRPADDRTGVLQDVHWSGGSFGYFPSYTLGNLYAASLGRAMEAELPTLWEDVREGRFGGVLSWLRARVHAHGHLYDPPELMRRAVGERDHVADLLDHLWARHGALYGVSR